MNFLEQIIAGLSGTMSEPQPYGWWHLMFIAITIIFIIAMGLIFRNKSKKAIRIVVLVYAIVCLLLEIYKQLLFSYNASSGVWSYRWYAFPFQFCSTSMYVALIAAMLKGGKVQDSLYSFLATFGLLAGLLVMLYPNDVFTSQIGINIQTMLHHGGQVFIGAFLLMTRQVKLDFKTPLRALPVYVALVGIALLLNIIMINFTNGATFNMFFISPYFPCTLPVFSIIFNAVPYVVFLLIYILGFTAGAYLIVLLSMAIRYFVRLSRRSYDNRKERKRHLALNSKE